MHFLKSFITFVAMNDELRVSIVTKSEELPDMTCASFFHSTDFFRIIEKTPGQLPYMVVVRRGDNVVAHMLATLRRRGSLVPPYLFSQGRVYGEGEYAEGEDKDELFKLMLKAITRKLRRRMCLYIEFSDLSHKMFGYRVFRNNGYFPVQWMEIHNSLHSLSPQERINEKTLQRIEHAHEAGVSSHEVETEEEMNGFYHLLSRFFSLKVRRYLPPKKTFELLHTTGNGRLFVTKHKNKVIGGSCCVYSGNNVYLWYMASKRKSHPTLHPSAVTIWKAITHAYEHDKWHIYFMDVGLPFKKNRYRDFILSFGGKEVGTYRWFRFSIPWMNKLVGWFYRE